MRGKVYSATMRIPSAWITPAYAGKSSKSLSFSLLCRDHPRLCGEKGFYKKIPSVRIGSPPPMRGKGQSVDRDTVAIRITPAYAGKRHSRQPLLCLSQDHPRLCGEKSSPLWHAVPCWGSPPPMRGKVHMSATGGQQKRITPAYAGKRL